MTEFTLQQYSREDKVMKDSQIYILPLATITAFLAIGWLFPVSSEELPTWVPGEPYPVELMKNYPCHDYELPCGKLSSPPIERVHFDGPIEGDAERGEKIAGNIRWGNCIACHALPKQEGGSIGPSLRDYAVREMPVEYTYQRIWDVRFYSPNAHMPVYGPNKVLTKQDIQDVMAYLYATE